MEEVLPVVVNPWLYRQIEQCDPLFANAIAARNSQKAKLMKSMTTGAREPGA